MTDIRGKGIYRAYQSAGVDFLAVRLSRIFTRIENEEDKVLHNDMLKDVLDIICHDEKGFFRAMAELAFKSKGRKRFLFRLAEQVLHIGQKKG